MIFALLLFGCADDGSQCQQLASTAKHYEARVTCEADAEIALQSDVALRSDYPTVEARCLPQGGDASITAVSGDPADDEPTASLHLAVARQR